MKKRLLIAADVDRSFIGRIEADNHFEVRRAPVTTEQALAETVGDAEVLVTRHYNKITRRVLEGAPHLEVIAQGTSGIDNIDESAAAARQVTILSVPGKNANAVAELVIGLMIALTRTVPFYDRMVRSGRWERADCASRRELRAYRLGIVGLGRVGSQVSALASGLGMSTAAYDPYLSDEQFETRGARRVASLTGLLDASEILTIHVPLTTETRGLLGPAELEHLPAGAIFINASRGEVAAPAELFERLRTGRLGGVALDVYENEPPAEIAFPDDPRLIVTPHIAGCTREAKESIGAALYETLCAHYGWEPRR